MLELLLQLNKGDSWPQINFNSPAVLVSESDVSLYQKNQCWQVDVSDEFKLDYINKGSNETIVDTMGNIVRDQSLEVCSVWYQGIKLNLTTVSKIAKFFPRYRDDFIEYCQQHSIVPDVGPLNQTKFWHSGTWEIEFPKDFWIQYKKFRFNHTHNDFVGISSDTIKHNLQRLKDLL